MKVNKNIKFVCERKINKNLPNMRDKRTKLWYNMIYVNIKGNFKLNLYINGGL